MNDNYQPEWVCIHVDLYRVALVIGVRPTIEAIVAHGLANGISRASLSKDWREVVGAAIPLCAGFTTTFGKGNRDILIWLRERPRLPNISILLHELYHATDEIANGADNNYSLRGAEGSSEARAFLFEYLARRAIEAFVKRRRPSQPSKRRKVKHA